jgi:Transmembrane amino acid transporter protein
MAGTEQQPLLAPVASSLNTSKASVFSADGGSSASDGEGMDGIENVEEILPARSATMASSWINLSNTILGAGMLGIPFAVDKAGLGLGLILLACCAGLAAFGLHLLGRAGAQFELNRKGKGEVCVMSVFSLSPIRDPLY